MQQKSNRYLYAPLEMGILHKLSNHKCDINLKLSDGATVPQTE